MTASVPSPAVPDPLEPPVPLRPRTPREPAAPEVVAPLDPVAPPEPAEAVHGRPERDGALPEPVRQRVLALAADALGRLPSEEVPAALRAAARFTPAKRARLAAS